MPLKWAAAGIPKFDGAYWDTACLVKLYVREPNSAEFEGYAASLNERPTTGQFACWEFWTVPRRKEAKSSLASGEARELLSIFDGNVARGMTRLAPLTGPGRVD